MNPMELNPKSCLPSLLQRTGAAAVILLLTLCHTVPAEAQIAACTASSCPPDFMQLDVNDIQYAPGLFKLQARVSQAKIPVGDAVFDQITVNLVRPGAAQNRIACTETIPGVRVRNSVLNIDIGRNMQSCQLDQVVAQEQDLAFEICINSPDNCLKPIGLGSTPYALKSSYAVVSQKAHSANESVQSHYAHRITADTELFVGERTHEDGYLDFVTPDPDAAQSTNGWERFSTELRADMQSAYGQDPTTSDPTGGFIQWTPVNTTSSQPALGTLHIVAKDHDHADKLLKPLARMMIHAEATFMTGELNVLPAAGYAFRSNDAGTSIDADSVQVDVNSSGASIDAVGSRLEATTAGSASMTGAVAAVTGSASVELNGGESQVTLDGNGMVCSSDAQFGQDATTRLDVYSTTEFHGPVQLGIVQLPSNSVSSSQIVNSAITSADIASNTITSANIRNGEVFSSDIRDGTVTGTDIADSTITGNDIANGTITGSDIASNTITGSDIASNSIQSSDIQDNTITTWDIANGTIGGSDLASNSVTTSKIANNSVEGADIRDGTITSSDLASSSVTSSKILNNTVESADIRDGTILGRDLANPTYYSVSNSNLAHRTLGQYKMCFVTYVYDADGSMQCQTYKSGSTWYLYARNYTTCGVYCL